MGKGQTFTIQTDGPEDRRTRGLSVLVAVTSTWVRGISTEASYPRCAGKRVSRRPMSVDESPVIAPGAPSPRNCSMLENRCRCSKYRLG